MWMFVIALAACLVPAGVYRWRWARSERDARAKLPTWPYRQEGHRVPILEPRPTARLALLGLGVQLARLALILITFQIGLWSFQDVGLPPVDEWGDATVVGAFTLVVWAIVAAMVSSVVTRAALLAGYRDMRGTAFRRQRDHWLWQFSILLAVITDDFWYRGVLVHQLGAEIGSPPVAIGLGLALHLWLSRLSPLRAGGLIRSVATYGVLIILLYSPAGLAGSIGFRLTTWIVLSLTGHRYWPDAWKRMRGTQSDASAHAAR